MDSFEIVKLLFPLTFDSCWCRFFQSPKNSKESRQSLEKEWYGRLKIGAEGASPSLECRGPTEYSFDGHGLCRLASVEVR